MSAKPASPELIEDLEWMARWGEVPEFAAPRVGCKPDTLRNKLKLAGRSDVWERLEANKPELNEDTARGHVITYADAYAVYRKRKKAAA